MPAFRQPLDVGNQALQHCGAKRISSFTENSINAAEVSFAYDKARETELSDRFWTFAIKHAVLRARDSNMMMLAPALWSAVTTYFIGSIVADENGNVWISNIPANLNNDPLLTTYWEPYCGPMGVPLYDSTISYYSGELVYKTPGDGTYKVYQSSVDGNSDDPATATTYDPTVTYFQDQVVTYSSVAYKSLADLNTGNQPNISPSLWTTTIGGGTGSVKWLEIGGSDFPSGVALTTINNRYPLGTGPATNLTNRNVFVLPGNYLRRAPQDPKQPVSVLGGPTGYGYDDWLIEHPFLISSDSLIALRFVADFTDVSRMDATFCEGLAARIAFDVIEKITQDTTKRQMVAKIYQEWERNSHTIDGIEAGPQAQPDDDWLTVRC